MWGAAGGITCRFRRRRQFAFHLFAEHNEEGGCLTPKLLGSFLGSFATVLCACTEEGMEMAPEVLRSVISAASETAVTSLLGESCTHYRVLLHPSAVFL